MWKKAITAYKKYLKLRKDDNPERYQVYIHMALAYKMINEYQLCRECLYLAQSIDPLRRDAHSLTGDIYIDKAQEAVEKGDEKSKQDAKYYYERAIYSLNQVLNLNPKASRMFQSGGNLTFLPHEKLAHCYSAVGDMPNATAHLIEANKYLNSPKYTEQLIKWKDKKKNILIIDALGSFTRPLYEHLKDRYNIVLAKRYDVRLCIWADYIWCEWADEDALLCADKFGSKTIVRLHGYEAYIRGHLHSQIKWGSLKKVVFVAPHIQERMASFVNGNGTLIYNGVDVDKFYIKNWDRKPLTVGYAGYLNTKKNPTLLLQIIKENPDVMFQLRVDHQDPFIKAQFEYETKGLKNIVYHGRYKDLNDFWNKCDGVLSTSIIESFSYNIAEAMACGCRPYIYNWNGAKHFYPEKYIFDKFPVFSKEPASKKSREEFRKHIIDNYDNKKILPKMEDLLIGSVDKETSQSKQLVENSTH